MKRGVCIVSAILMALMLSATVLADLSVVFGPNTAYETSTNFFQINISNVRSPYEIVEVRADMEGFDISSMMSYEGWSDSYTGSVASWTDGMVSNNVYLAKFDFYAKALSVEEEQEVEAEIYLIDSNGDNHEFNFLITVQDDKTPPNVSQLLPQGFVKQGDSQVEFSAIVEDQETGIESVTLEWKECEANATVHTLQLAETDGRYQTTIDLSSYADGEEVCYTLSATNGGGDVTTEEGTLTIDGIPPEVTLVSPLNEALFGLNRNFSFFASDNLALEMRCSMYIDGIEYIKDIEAEHMDVEFIPSADAEEGEHTWSVKCTDPAGWEGESATWAYFLDLTRPTIVMTTPENDSIVAADTIAEFEVSDNHALWKVYSVIDGVTEEVNSEFSIDVSGWPDGPSEFAVLAEDSVGNRAEQTYRLIIDRNPPQIELLGPADGETSDVHVNFRYSVLDDYDDAMDCNVYTDDTAKETHSAVSGEETVHIETVQLGAHRWKVRCVDDAGNQAESDERQVNVVDTSGPDITAEDVEDTQRGDPVEISLHIDDVSGVESATAMLRYPDDHTQSIPLEKGDTYTAQIDTALDWEPGKYVLEVYAVDTLDHSSTYELEFNIVYSYVIVMSVTPSTVSPSGSVVVSGTAIYDNSSLIPEETITLELPGNVSVDTELVNGDFTHTFTAPSTDGLYELTASAGGFFETTPLTVYTAPVTTSGGSGGGGHGTHYSAPEEDETECDQLWKCTAWNPCNDGEQKRTCVDYNQCGDDRKVETRQCTMTTEEENGYTEEGTVTAVREPLPAAEEQQIDATEEDTGTAAGIGKASSFMSLDGIGIKDLLLVIGLMGMLIGVLYRYGWGKGDNRKTPAAVDFLATKRDRLGLEDYLNDRAARRNRW